MKPERPSLPSAMLVTLLSSIAVFTAMYLGFLIMRYALAVLEDVREQEIVDGVP
jgi:hypothetical protein